LHCYCAIYINLFDIFHLLINLLCEITRGKSQSRYDCQYQRAMQESVLFIEILCYLNKGRYRGSTKMSRHGHHRVRLVLSMTLSNAEAISHMAYGMLYRIHYATAYLALQYVHQWSRVAHVAPRTMHRRLHRRRRGGRGKKADEGKARRLEKRAVSPSMLLSRDKAEDADIRAYSRYTEWSFAISFCSSDFARD